MWAIAASAFHLLRQPESCHVLLDSPEMLAVAKIYAGWTDDSIFRAMDAFKATYQPPNNSARADLLLLWTANCSKSRIPGSVAEPRELQARSSNYARDPPSNAARGEDPFNWAGGFAFAMPKGSSMSKPAWELMKFYAGYEGQKIYMPALTEDSDIPRTTTDPKHTTPHPVFCRPCTSRIATPTARRDEDVGCDGYLQDSLNQKSRLPRTGEHAQQYVNPTMQQFCRSRSQKASGARPQLLPEAPAALTLDPPPAPSA